MVKQKLVRRNGRRRRSVSQHHFGRISRAPVSKRRKFEYSRLAFDDVREAPRIVIAFRHPRWQPHAQSLVGSVPGDHADVAVRVADNELCLVHHSRLASIQTRYHAPESSTSPLAPDYRWRVRVPIRVSHHTCSQMSPSRSDSSSCDTEERGRSHQSWPRDCRADRSGDVGVSADEYRAVVARGFLQRTFQKPASLAFRSK